MDHEWEARFFNPRAIQAQVERRAIVTKTAEIQIGPSFEYEGLFDVTVRANYLSSEQAMSCRFEAEALSELQRALYGAEFQEHSLRADRTDKVIKRISHSIRNDSGDALTLEANGESAVPGRVGVKIRLVTDKRLDGLEVWTTAHAVKGLLEGIDHFTRNVNYAPPPVEQVAKCDGDHPMPPCADPGCWLSE
jgi:hypothetical protein